MASCHILGVLDDGPEGLCPQALAALRRADVVVGNERTLTLVSSETSAKCERKNSTGSLACVPSWVEEATRAGKNSVVLATGDPLCHGLATYVINALGPDECTVIPNRSVLQVAYSRLGLTWQGARAWSVHGQDAGEWTSDAGPGHPLYPLLREIRRDGLLGVFTSEQNNPARIARMLHQLNLGRSYEMAVLECALRADERLTHFATCSTLVDREFRSPNVVVLRPRAITPARTLFGLPDEVYAQRRPSRGLITKREVRAVSLAQLQLRPDSIVWDIGAGSGSVGLVAARLCPDGFVFAIEKNPADAALIRENQRNFQITNYRLCESTAPQGLAEWNDPDAVFIGGSGGHLKELITLAMSRLRDGGHLVMNFVTFENLHTATDALKESGFSWILTQLQVSRGKNLLGMQRLEALTPVWVVTAWRGEA